MLPDDPRAKRLASLARSPAEHLVASDGFARLVAERGLGPSADGASATPAAPLVVHPHCHGRAIGTPRSDRELLYVLGRSAMVLDAGCCGLAGSFGYRAEHEPISRKIAEEQWLPKIRSAAERAGQDTVVVDGFSCVMQLEQTSELRATALISTVRQALGC
jgi:Fe-S oxidoreductase